MGDRTVKRSGLFWQLAADYKKNCATSAETIACPLCLTEYSLANASELTREHIVPSKLGGRSSTLTCRRCNNTHGSYLDSHLITLMKSLDALEGAEPIQTSLINDKGKITAELVLGPGTPDEPIAIRIIGQASNIDAVENLRSGMGTEPTLNLKMSFPFVPERYVRAAFRAAFLSVFRVQGYEYALSVGAEQVRTALFTDGPVLENVVMQAFPESDPSTDLLVMPASFNDVGEYYAVLLRLRTRQTRYICVFLPGKGGSNWSAFRALYEHVPNLHLETTPDSWDSKLHIRFGCSPMDHLKRTLRERFMPTSSRNV